MDNQDWSNWFSGTGDASGSGSVLNVSVQDSTDPTAGNLEIGDWEGSLEEFEDQDNIYVAEEDFDIGADFSSDLSNLETAYVDFQSGDSVEGSEDISSTSETISLEAEDVDDGSYTLKFNATDVEGNEFSSSREITVDTTPPDTDGSINTDDPAFTETRTLEVSLESTDDVDEVTCYLGDPASDGSVSVGTASSQNDGVYECDELDPEEYADGSHTVWVRVADAAGNYADIELSEITVDSEPPAITEADVVPRYTNDDPEVTVNAEDSGVGLQSLEYDFEEFEGGEAANSIDLSGNEDSATFRPNMSDRGQGEFIIYTKVADEAGKYSETGSMDFTYDPEANTTVSISASTLEVTENSSATAEITLENQGKVPVVGGKLKVTGPVSGESSEFRVDGNDEEQVNVPVEAQEPYGSYTADIELSSDLHSESGNLEVIVEASDSTQSDVESEIEELRNRFNQVQQQVEELRDRG